MSFYKIAGLKVRMETFGRTLKQAEIYRCEPFEDADIVVQPRPEHYDCFPRFSDDDSEYMLTGSDFFRKLLAFDAMMLHSSAVMMDGRAYLFSAPSGTGKSTHTKLWISTFGEDKAQIINDDKPVLRQEDGAWYAYGSPWSGKSTTSLNVRVPVGGICVLRRGEKNHIERYEGTKAVFAIMDQTMRGTNVQFRTNLLRLVGSIVEKVPIYEMHCNMEPEAALLSHSVMSGNL